MILSQKKLQKKPIVVIDARMIRSIPHGISRYVSELCRGLDQLHQITPLLYEPIFLTAPGLSQSFGSFQSFPIPVPFLSLTEVFKIPPALKHLHASLYHSPSFSSLWSCPCPSIITIHDLNHLIYGSWSKKLYYKSLLRRFALQSECITTVSQFSQKELSEWLKIPAEKIEVVSNSLEFCSNNSEEQVPESQLKKYQLMSHQYFFCLSHSKPHKNLALLVEAYQMYRNQNPHSWPLVLNVSEFSQFPGVQSVGHLSTSDARLLMSHAGGVFFPSLYEGFGLPPLEGALFGAPLAVSSIPPHREGLVDLSPDAVCWTEPNDRDGWIKAFEKIQTGQIAASSPTQRLQIVQRFSSKRLAAHMDLLYRRVLGLQA